MNWFSPFETNIHVISKKNAFIISPVVKYGQFYCCHSLLTNQNVNVSYNIGFVQYCRMVIFFIWELLPHIYVNAIIFTTGIQSNIYDMLTFITLKHYSSVAIYQCSWLASAVTVWDDLQQI